MSHHEAGSSLLLTKTLEVLEQRRRSATIAFAATVLAVMVSSASPSPDNAELQTEYSATADNNPITIVWGPGSENVDPERITTTLLVIGGLLSVFGATAYLDNRENK